MQELEKILREIEAEFDRRIDIQLKIMAGLGDDVYRYGYGRSVEAYQQGKLFVEDIIRKYMNDGWISVDERMPTQEECKDNLFWITYGYFSSSSRVAQCQWVLSYDENGNDDSYSEFYIDQAPSIYVPSQNLVTAWKIINIPDPYRPERSERK